MPEMDGFQMIRALREFNVTARTPIIVISGLSDADIEEEGGLPDDVLLLHKPVDKLRFLALIQQAFAHCQGAKAEAGAPAGG
jgi:CheY-like chemotaxis protein